MSKELTPEEKAEQELAEKITALIKERTELEFRRGNGVTLGKNDYIGDRLSDIEKELCKLKSKPNDTNWPHKAGGGKSVSYSC